MKDPGMLALAVLVWASLAAVLWIVVRILQRPDAGFGAGVWRGQSQPRGALRRTGPGSRRSHPIAPSTAHR